MAELRLDRLVPAQAALLRAASEAGAGRDAVVVGGAVRDVILRRLAADVDVAVPTGAIALARRCAERVRGTCVVLDAERGAARVVVEGGLTLDVTDFRGPTLAVDFTVDALAVPLDPLLARGRAAIVDPTGGLADLAARRLRPAGPGVLADDPLRALRAVRLEATLGLRLTPTAARSVRDAARGLGRVAAERVRDELLILLTLPETARALRRADALGVLGAVMPEIEPMRATKQPLPHRFDVLEHSLRAVGGCDRLLAHLDALAPYGDELRAHVASERPEMAGDGRLRYRGRWTQVSPIDERMLQRLVSSFEDVVGAGELHAAAWPDGEGTSGALRIHVLRIRQALEPLGLEVQRSP